jgi:hypothetical protein
LQIESCLFQDSRSQDRGGAISAVGAVVHITATRFVNSSSLGNGGGAIFATDVICYGSTQAFTTVVDIKDSIFEGCSSSGSGGAVVVTSSLASVNISSSLFMACSSARQGGAVASIDGGSAKLVDSILVFNTASGQGGGALYSENAHLILHGVSAHGNKADAGGGGVLYWLGQLPPTVISWCRQGTYPDPSSVCDPTTCSSSCLPCQKGTYLTGSGAESQGSCLPCDAGSYSSLLGSTASTYCSNCSAGFFSTAKGATHPSVCAACEPGSYADMQASTTCMMCEPGAYTSVEGSSTCLLCPPGTYLTSSGASHPCMECPGGSFSYHVGSVACTPCDAGYYSRLGAKICTLCPAGSFTSASSSTVCESCLPGQFSDPGAGSCAVCWAGTFSTGFGMNSSGSCTACSDGLFSGRGASRCLPIDGFRAGTVSNVFSNGSEVTQINLPLPFPFNFYGEDYWNVTVSMYGLLGMGECILDELNVVLPSTHLEQSIVAVFWQPLAAPVSNGFIQWSDNDTITFQWTDWSTVSWAGIGGSLTFQISLMRNGSFLLSYVELDGLMAHGDMATVGFQGGDDGVTISFYSAYPGVRSGLCYLVSPDPIQSDQYSVERYICPDNLRLVATCEPGEFLGTDYQCILCSAGTYQTGMGMQNKNNCSLCAPGTCSQFSGATTAEDCSECAVDSSINSSLLSEVAGCMGRASLSGHTAVRSNQVNTSQVIQLEAGRIPIEKKTAKNVMRCIQLPAPFPLTKFLCVLPAPSLSIFISIYLSLAQLPLLSPRLLLLFSVLSFILSGPTHSLSLIQTARLIQTASATASWSIFIVAAPIN